MLPSYQSHFGVYYFSLVRFLIVQHVVFGNGRVDSVHRNVHWLHDVVDVLWGSLDQVVVLGFELLDDFWGDPLLDQVESAVSDNHFPSKQSEVVDHNLTALLKLIQRSNAVFDCQVFSVSLSQFLNLVADVMHEDIVVWHPLLF